MRRFRHGEGRLVVVILAPVVDVAAALVLFLEVWVARDIVEQADQHLNRVTRLATQVGQAEGSSYLGIVGGRGVAVCRRSCRLMMAAAKASPRASTRGPDLAGGPL
jgi:hypothetical protein